MNTLTAATGIIASLMLVGCASSTSLSTPPTQPVPSHSIEQSTLIACAPIPTLKNGQQKTRLNLTRWLINEYGLCRKKHQALSDYLTAEQKRDEQTQRP